MEHAEGRSGRACASDRQEAVDVEAAIRGAQELCRKAAGMRLTGAVLMDEVGQILWSFSRALAHEPLCVRPTR